MTILDLLPSETILQQRYRIIESVGQGGMGAVYAAIDQRLNTRVALKQILRATPTLRQAFEHEAKLLANLRHSGLPRVIDYFSEANADFIVMEFIDGKDLGQVLRERGPLPVEEVLSWADQLLDVIQYLHSQNPPIIHRDIKPENIKLTQTGALVLLDFGIAKGNLGAETTTGVSQSVVAWTLHYVPPEQFLREGTEERSDLFAFAATLYHLLSNQQPVPIDRRIGQVQNDQPDPLKPVAQINARVPTAVSELIHQAMARKLDQRPASAIIFRDALRAAAGAHIAIPPSGTEVGTQTDELSPLVMPEKIQPEPVVPIVKPARSIKSSQPTPGRNGQLSLQKRIHTLVHQVLERYEGAWMVWCDPRSDWRPLLERVATDTRLGGFELVIITDATAGELGGLQSRQRVQELITNNKSFVLLVPTSSDQLGWLWAQTLLAEQVYSKSLFDQLLEWGWRPPSQTITADEVAILAWHGLQQDPLGWGSGGIQPDLPILLDVLAGGSKPDPEQEYILARTIEATGLPPLDLADLERWRIRSLAHLLITQAHQIAPRLVSANHEMLIPESQRSLALELLTRWSDSLRLSRKLPQLIMNADRIADLGSLLREVTIKHGPFISRTAEHVVFTNTCARLAQKTGKDLLQTLADLESDLVRHAHSFWGDRSGQIDSSWVGLAIPWGELLRLSRAAQDTLAAAPASDWGTPEAALHWYTESGWRLDAAGEEIIRNLTRSTPELLGVITQLRDTYRTRWEKSLIQWSDVWRAAGCPTPQLPTAGTWLKTVLGTLRPTAILFIDALRYDLGIALADMINSHEGTVRALVRPARAPLPSVTALGMGMALPIPENELRAELVGGSWQLINDPTQLDLSVAENRRVWLREHNGVAADAILALGDIIGGSIPPPTKTRKRLVITDTTIDQLGHDDELERLGSGIALERYREAIIRLRDTGWLHIAIVTDHGYIHWSGSDERRLQPPIASPAYRSRRALAYPANTALQEPHTRAPGSQWKVIPAPGAASWSAYGGLGYFHGGASLQEWIIPCVQIDWPAKAQPVQVSLQPLEHILSAQPRIMLNIERTSLLLEDAIPRHIDIIVRHQETRVILFRSAQTEVTSSQSQRSISLRLTPGSTAEWGAPLLIEVRDALTEEVLDSTNSILRVRLDEW